jgi:hypothetical protein
MGRIREECRLERGIRPRASDDLRPHVRADLRLEVLDDLVEDRRVHVALFRQHRLQRPHPGLDLRQVGTVIVVIVVIVVVIVVVVLMHRLPVALLVFGHRTLPVLSSRGLGRCRCRPSMCTAVDCMSQPQLLEILFAAVLRIRRQFVHAAAACVISVRGCAMTPHDPPQKDLPCIQPPRRKWPFARAPAWHPDRREGQHRHRRPAHDLRIALLRGPRADRRCRGRRASAPCRRGHRRQIDAARVRSSVRARRPPWSANAGTRGTKAASPADRVAALPLRWQPAWPTWHWVPIRVPPSGFPPRSPASAACGPPSDASRTAGASR